MKTLILYWCLSVFSGCGSVAPELKPHVDEFLFDADRYGFAFRNVEFALIEWYDLDEDVAGTCTQNPDTKKIAVKISPKYKGDEIMIRAIIYHELGHCLLHLPHNITDVKINGTSNPTSRYGIMNETLLPKEVYLKHWEMLVYNLFTEGM